MTVRHRTVGAITVYAGAPAELAAVAEEYADGRRPMPQGLSGRLLEVAAEQLRTGRYPIHDLGALRFYSDHADGSPHQAPYAPDPDPAWAAQHTDSIPAEPTVTEWSRP